MAEIPPDRAVAGPAELLNDPVLPHASAAQPRERDVTTPMPQPYDPPTPAAIQPPPPFPGGTPQPAPPANPLAAPPDGAIGPDPFAAAAVPAPPTVPPQSVRGVGWSPLGAAPAGPPVRSGPGPGETRYLPPVAPPTVGPTGPAAVPIDHGPTPHQGDVRWGWRAVVAFVAGGLIAAAGFVAAQIAPGSEIDAASGPSVTATPVNTTVAVAEAAPDPLSDLEGDEPAAVVAQLLGPSVVQIDTRRGVGSGVIYGDGLILTNNHVIDGVEDVQVMLADGRIMTGRVLGNDINTDVAVVSVGPGENLPIATLATGEKARVGQMAIAIGSPFDLQQSVTAGIVSAVDRPIQNNEQSVVAMIQTDAPINPGNSGGALADRRGRVIGINTSIQTDGLTNANVGVGFAIPIDTAVRIADLLVEGKPIEPGFLGVRGADPRGGEAGVELIEVTAGSAAEAAGLRVGDRVLSLNGAPVTQFAELAGLVLANQAGDTVSLEVVRNGNKFQLDVTLGLRGEN